MNDFKLDAIFEMSSISPKTQKHVAKVYSILGLGIVNAGVFGFISSNGFIPYYVIYFVLIATIIAEIVFLFTRHSKFAKETLSPINYYATTGATGAFVGLLFTLGLSNTENQELKSIIMTAFIITAAIFLSMSLFAILTVRRLKIFFGCLISSFVLSIIGIFVFNSDFSALLGVLIGVLYVIIDTQLMINKAENGIIEPYEDARHIYYNLFRIFINIIVLLSKTEKKKKN